MTTLFDELELIDPLPVDADTQPPPVAQLIRRLDTSIRPLDTVPPTLHTRRRPPRRRRVIAAAAVACASLAVALALSDVGGGGHLDVAAAAYQATTTGPGVLHMSIVSERTIGGSTRSTSAQIWTAQNPRRMRLVHTDSEETLESTLSTEPVRELQWSSSRPTVIEESSPAGIDKTEVSPVAVIHRLLGEGRASVIGKATYEGHEAWELQMHPQAPPASFDGSQLPDPTLLVAAGTYAPLELIEHYVTSENGKPELAEQRERYVEYEELPTNAQDEALLTLAPHSGASVRRQG